MTKEQERNVQTHAWVDHEECCSIDLLCEACWCQFGDADSMKPCPRPEHGSRTP